MTEFVYRRVRVVRGKRVVSSVYSGRYALRSGDKLVSVVLGTRDKLVAQKRLRDLVIEKQREAEGILAPQVLRDAAAAPLVDLVEAYAVDLRARTVSGHASESLARIRKIITATGWARLSDVTPSSWVAYRASLVGAAKTVKEYQTSFMAFLNWLVRMEKLLVNPLARVGSVKIKGKAVRKSRAFTQAEFSALLASAPESRRLVYLFLAYTGARKNEARSLLWSDLQLSGDASCVRFREEETKGAVKRVVPLRSELVSEFLAYAAAYEQAGGAPVNDALVFSPFPSDDAFYGDLKRAGIERKDATGRVLHFHAFRKTFQTWGAAAGVGQRSAQEILGHSDPSLTAGAYTDVAGLQLHAEVAKLPWLGGGRGNGPLNGAQKPEKAAVSVRFRALLSEMINMAQEVVSEGETLVCAAPSLAARHGFEP